LREERNQYEDKCKGVEFFSFALVYDHKETDICISNTSGHYNFILIRDALQALIGKSNKENKKMKK